MVFTVLQIEKLAFHTTQKDYLDSQILLESGGKTAEILHWVLTSNPTNGKMAHVCQIFILQQINIEKNGFHSLTD